MIWLLAMWGCVPPAPIHFSTVHGSDPSLVSQVEARHEPGLGWQLVVTLQLRNPAQTHRRVVDLSHAALRVDGGAWERCHHSADTDVERLIVTLRPGEEKQREICCQDIPSPEHSLSLRLPVTNPDNGSGMVILEHTRVDP